MRWVLGLLATVSAVSSSTRADESSTVKLVYDLGGCVSWGPGNTIIGVSVSSMTDEQLRTLQDLPQLAGLDISSPFGVMGFSRLTDSGLKEVKQLKHLTRLKLSATNVTDEGLKELKELKQLARLDLGRTNITDRGLEQLKELSQLTFLDLHMTKVTDRGLKDLKSFDRLARLNLGLTMVTDAGLKELRVLKQLANLDLNCCYSVTDVGLSELSELRELRKLNLNSCTKVTDSGLKVLANLKHLKELSLWNTQVTSAGEIYLTNALPKCHIFSERRPPLIDYVTPFE